MLVCETIAQVRDFVKNQRNSGSVVGFVPTMGYLHRGHMALIESARNQCDVVVASIFVNPLQFGPKEDYAQYPRDFDRDSRMLEEYGVDLLFCPTVEEMFPAGFCTHVGVSDLTEGLCGRSRPGHFQGVATVVTKFFNIVLPDLAYFGQKDAQQVLVIKKMVEDLNMPLGIVAVPIIREEDGLAMSSRNVYLSPKQRDQAPLIFESLQQAAHAVEAGERDTESLIEGVRTKLSKLEEASIDYVEIRSLENLTELKLLDRPALLAVAVRLGKTRLIDNIILEG